MRHDRRERRGRRAKFCGARRLGAAESPKRAQQRGGGLGPRRSSRRRSRASRVGRRHPRRCGARPGALAGGAGALSRGARTCGRPNRPAAGSVRSTTRVRAPSVSELPGQLTTSVEREVDVPGGAERAQERSRAVRRRCQGAPARLVDRTGVRSGSARPLESVHYGTQGGGFRVQHSLNVPALVGTASSDVRIFPAQRAPRSGPRRAPGGNTPHPHS